jgi:hypothetical protein
MDIKERKRVDIESIVGKSVIRNDARNLGYFPSQQSQQPAVTRRKVVDAQRFKTPSSPLLITLPVYIFYVPTYD